MLRPFLLYLCHSLIKKKKKKERGQRGDASHDQVH